MQRRWKLGLPASSQITIIIMRYSLLSDRGKHFIVESHNENVPKYHLNALVISEMDHWTSPNPTLSCEPMALFHRGHGTIEFLTKKKKKEKRSNAERCVWLLSDWGIFFFKFAKASFRFHIVKMVQNTHTKKRTKFFTKKLSDWTQNLYCSNWIKCQSTK